MHGETLKFIHIFDLNLFTMCLNVLCKYISRAIFFKLTCNNESYIRQGICTLIRLENIICTGKGFRAASLGCKIYGSLIERRMISGILRGLEVQV